VASLAVKGPLAGDQAVLDLAAQHAQRFGQLLGPYDRFGWHHLGPAYLYILALARTLSSGAPWYGSLTSVVLNGGCLVLTGITLGGLTRSKGPRSGAFIAIAMVAVAMAYGRQTLATFWNPDVAVMPVILATALAGLAVERQRVWPWLAAVLAVSFAVQTDISTAPAGLAVLVVSGLILAMDSPRWPIGSRHPMKHAPPNGEVHGRSAALVAVAMVAALLVIWTPPLLQEFRAGLAAGNLTRVAEFFLRSHPHPSWAAATTLAGTAMLPAFLPISPSLGTALVAMGVVQVAGLAALWLAFERRLPGAAFFSCIACLGPLATVESARLIVGQPYDYLVGFAVLYPASALMAFALWLQDSHNVGPRVNDPRPGRRRWADRLLTVDPGAIGWTAALAVSLIATVACAVTRPPTISHSAAVRWDWHQLDARLQDIRPAEPILVKVNNSSWPVAAGLIDLMRQAGYDPVVQTSWAFMFGDWLVDHHAPDTVLNVGASGCDVMIAP
jgi:hypothetical protein